MCVSAPWSVCRTGLKDALLTIWNTSAAQQPPCKKAVLRAHAFQAWGVPRQASCIAGAHALLWATAPSQPLPCSLGLGHAGNGATAGAVRAGVGHRTTGVHAAGLLLHGRRALERAASGGGGRRRPLGSLLRGGRHSNVPGAPLGHWAGHSCRAGSGEGLHTGTPRLASSEDGGFERSKCAIACASVVVRAAGHAEGALAAIDSIAGTRQLFVHLKTVSRHPLAQGHLKRDGELDGV